MKKVFALIGCASMLFAFGCTKEKFSGDEPVSKGSTKITLTADFTKTTIGGLSENIRSIYWAKGDQVNVNGEVSDALPDDLPAETRSVTFTFTDKMLIPPFKAVYPAAIWKDASTVTIPASVPMGVVPLSAYGDMSSLPVKPLSAILKLTVKKAAENPDADKVVKVILSSEDTRLSGDFSIDYENGVLTPAANPTDAEKTISLDKTFYPTDEGYELFIPVPAGTYGLKLKLVDNQGHFMEVPTSAPKTFVAGQVKALTAFEFKPTGTQIDIVINTPQDLVDFATAYNSKSLNAPFVQLGADLTFDSTTSDAFNATGGIGLKESYGDAEDLYFNGIFDGNDKTISGLIATVPLIKATGSDGTVKNLIINDDCTFTFTQANTAEANFGALVDYHKGHLENITVKADVALAPVADITKLTTVGGVAGRVTVGTLKDCAFNGNLSVPSGFATTNKLVMGGLVGSLTNTGSISDSFLNGTVLAEAKVVIDDRTNPYLIIGGILGLNSGGGSVIRCETTDHPTVNGYYGSDGTTPLPATIVLNTAFSYHNAIGGIVGECIKGSVSSCKNAATIGVTMLSTSDTDSRYIRTGGIAGYSRSEASITDCVNNAKLTHRANPRLHSIGGIAGVNGGTVTGCTNNGALAINTTSKKPYSGRVTNIGGVLGENLSENVSDLHNTAQAQISRVEETGKINIRMGGVIGSNSASIDGGEKQFTNSGKVYFSATNSVLPEDMTYGYCLGGIAGYSKGGIRNAVNEGVVQIPKWSTGKPGNMFMGGIVGRGIDAPLSDCLNKGDVFTSSNTTAGTAFTATDQPIRMGGIAGELTGASSIGSCHNQALIYLNAGNNTVDDPNKSFFEGGIVGFAQGSESARIAITECTWVYSAVKVGARRGYCGGVVGYAEYADVSSCEVTVNYNKYNYYTGGIAGWSLKSTLTGCKFHGTELVATEGFGLAGVVAKLEEASVVDGCYSYAKTITGKADNNPTLGGIAASSSAGTTIKNCHYTTAYPICPDSNFTDGGGNVADL